QDGRYRVAVTYANGCKSLSEEAVVDLAAIPGTGAPQVKLWPNPTDGLIYLKGMPLLPPLGRVRLLNLLGQTLATWQYADPARRRWTSLSIGGFAKGTYLLVVEAEGRSYVFKVAKH
ncbi:MAG: T9SS type A sorting domain-containing protein, partial [Cytophagales bacterium]|nr:T9SS type A sorting domain-containing protein [Cytophagales bacterium]